MSDLIFVIRFFIYCVDSMVLWLSGWRKVKNSTLKFRQYVDPKTCGHYPRKIAVEICEHRLRET